MAGNISDQTTVYSNVSLVGNVLTNTLSIGTQGYAIPAISSTSSSVGVWVVQGSSSSFTVVTWTNARPGDVIITSPNGGAGASSVSSGLVPWSHCTQAGQVEFRLSNASTLVQNQTAQVWNFIAIRPR